MSIKALSKSRHARHVATVVALTVAVLLAAAAISNLGATAEKSAENTAASQAAWRAASCSSPMWMPSLDRRNTSHLTPQGA